MAGSLVSPTGSHLSIKSFSPSPDGRYIAYGLAAGGAEMPTLHILNVATGKDLPETAERAGFPGAQFWRADGSAFYYARLQRLEPGMPPTATYQNSRVFLHVVGSPFDRDRSVLGTGVTGQLGVALSVDTLFGLSRKEAPRGEIRALDLSRPGSLPRVLVPQGEL